MTLPEFFEPLLAHQYRSGDVERILTGCHVRRKTTLRANTLLASREEVARALDDAGIVWSPVPWYEDAFIVENACERDLWNLEAYRQGKLYLQSLSSMIPPLVLGAQAGEDVLDMCAAPGGKTTQIAALSNGKAHLTACEMHAPRAEKLEHNLSKLGARNVVVMRTDARRLDDFFRFDRILVDAPCSGSGTIWSQDPKIARRFTPALVEKSRKSQRALLSKALSLLKPGGTLVYSTCSVLESENEDIVRDCLEKARRKASFELKPIALGCADVQELKPAPETSAAAETATNLDTPASSASSEPSEQAAPTTLPTLPSSLDEALLVCPTEEYEGFFTVKIERHA